MFKYHLYKVLKICHLISKKKYQTLTAKYTKEYKIIARSGLFDAKWYFQQNPDLDPTQVDPIEHYLKYGWQENRKCIPDFDAEEYLKFRPELTKLGMNPLIHMICAKQKQKSSLLGPVLLWAANCSWFKRDTIVMCDCVFEPKAMPLDNFTFFKYLISTKNNDLKTYYILNKKNESYPQIKKEYKEHIIGFTSRYNPVFCLRIFFLTFKMRYVLDAFDVSKKIWRDAVLKSKYIDSIFTQHGITFFKPGFIRPYVYGQENFKKVTVSNDIEKEIFEQRGDFKPENIIKSGLFRWDLIHDTSNEQEEKYIFIYFTHRFYLQKEEHPEDSVYFRNICKLLEDRDLQEFMQQHHTKFTIALHHTLLKYVDVNKMPNINFLKEDEIGEMKNKASMLITDYSSMCFEFLLPGKPVIFYRLDEEEFKNSELDCRYSPNIEESDKLLFNVVRTQKEVSDMCCKYILSEFKLDEASQQKADKFFYYKSDICKRFLSYLKEHWENIE